MVVYCALLREAEIGIQYSTGATGAEGVLVLECNVPPSRCGRDHRPSCEGSESSIALVLGEAFHAAGHELRKVSHGDQKHTAISGGHLDQPQQCLGVCLGDPNIRNRLPEKVGRNNPLGEAGATKGIDMLDSPPGIGRTGRPNRRPHDVVNAPRARRSPKERSIDSHAVNVLRRAESGKYGADGRGSVAGAAQVSNREGSCGAREDAPAKLAVTARIEADKSHQSLFILAK